MSKTCTFPIIDRLSDAMGSVDAVRLALCGRKEGKPGKESLSHRNMLHWFYKEEIPGMWQVKIMDLADEIGVAWSRSDFKPEARQDAAA